MTADSRGEAVAEELERCEEELSAARGLIALGLNRPAMTRIYYAAFHAVRALLYSEGLEPRSHEGAQHLFNLHFIRPGRIEPKWNRVLARLQKFREEADYGRAFVVDTDGVMEELGTAESLTARVARLLGSTAEPDASG